MGAYSIKIETGTYPGTSKVIDERLACEGPNFALVKKLTGTPSQAHVMLDRMPRNACGSWGGATSVRVNHVTDLTRDGFAVGQNQSLSGDTYAYLTIKSRGDRYFQTGVYAGNAVDNRNIENTATDLEGTAFPPDWVVVQRHTAGNQALFRSAAQAGDVSQSWAGVESANLIQALLTKGFQIGNNSLVNGAGANYNWMAMRKIPGGFDTGVFIGTGIPQEINVGFQPTCVFVKNVSRATEAILLMRDMPAPMILNNVNADYSATVTGLTPVGFTVGTSDMTNFAGDKIVWIALRDGEYSPVR